MILLLAQLILLLARSAAERALLQFVSAPDDSRADGGRHGEPAAERMGVPWGWSARAWCEMWGEAVGAGSERTDGLLKVGGPFAAEQAAAGDPGAF